MASVLLAALLATALGAGAASNLAAAAASGGAPPECAAAGAAGAAEPTIWARTLTPTRSAYCSALARADAAVEREPSTAQAAAEQARKLEPNRAAPYVALGRIATRLGDPTAALAAFERALAFDAHCLTHPDALRGYASALRAAGRLPESLRHYRMVVPRLSLVPDRGWRARTLLEAAHLCLSLAGREASPELLAEAHSYLRRALDEPYHELRIDALLSLALVHDRSGRVTQADATLAGMPAALRWSPSGAERYLAASADRDALQALALERTQPSAAAAAWRRFVARTDVPEPWMRPARARLAKLERAPAARPPGAKR